LYAVSALLLLLSSTSAFAQASITGVVKDASGGVLPGVSVEAASPALIEKSGRRSPTARVSTGSKISGPARTASRFR
jgi:hypothetical protein